MTDYIQHIKPSNSADIMKTGERIQFLCGMIQGSKCLAKSHGIERTCQIQHS